MSLSQNFNQKLSFKTPEVSNANFNDSPPETYQTATPAGAAAAAMIPDRRALEREQRLQARAKHMPVVQSASRSLQAVCGIESGTKMIGKTAVRLWELPKESVQDMVKNAQRKMAESLGKGRAGDGQPPVVASGVSGNASQPGQSLHGTPRIPEIVIHSPGAAATAPAPSAYQPPVIQGPLPAQQQHLSSEQSTSAPSCSPASPPPDWAPPLHTSHQYHIPGYYSNGLARELNKWLAKSSTRSKQLTPARVELRDAKTNRLYVGVDSTSCAKLKLSRIELPASVLEGPSAGPNTERPRDWIVVEVRHAPLPPRAQVTASGRVREWGEILPGEDMDDDENKPFIPCGPGECPFWLLAFHFCAITGSKKEVREQQKPERPQMGNVKRSEEFETLFLGGKGRAPIVTRRGLDPKFAKDFLEACGNGSGVLAFSGEGSLLTW